MAHTASASDYIDHGNSCFRNNQLTEAAGWYKKATESAPDSFAAHANLGNTLLQLDYHEEAIRAYLRALSLKPSAPLVARNLGECFEKTNRLDMAEQYYNLSIQIRPGDAETYVDLGNALQKQGRNTAAFQQLQKALELNPKLSSALHNMALCVYDDQNLHKAENAFRLAVDIDPGNTLGMCFLGIILEHQGKHNEAKDFLTEAGKNSAFNNCLISSTRYAFENGGQARFFSNTTDLLRHSIKEADHDGLFLELGVYYGNSLSIIADSTKSTVHGFDSFEGLPESWYVGDEKGPLATEPSGAYTTRGVLPNTPKNAELHVGWFEDSLPKFVAEHETGISFMNIDCDIYSSTKTIFDFLGSRIDSGTIIVFDEYFCYPEWKDHEYKAFQEWLAQAPFTYEYIGFSYFTGQAAVRVLKA